MMKLGLTVDVQWMFTIIILFGKAININQDKMYVRIKEENKMYKSISTELRNSKDLIIH